MLKRLSVTNNVARLRVPCSVVTMVMNEVSYDIIGVANQSRQGLSHAQCPEAVSRVLHTPPSFPNSSKKHVSSTDRNRTKPVSQHSGNSALAA